MSSHHIVRENQEPALLIQHFNALDAEYLGQVLEWSPTIITDEQNLDFLLSEDIKVDILFTKENISLSQEQIKQVAIYDSFEKDALQYLIDNNYKAVNVLVNQIHDFYRDYASHINIVLFYDSRRYVFVKDKYQKWMPKGEKVYISPTLLKSFSGLNFISEDVFETVEDGFYTVEFNNSVFVLIGEDI